MVSLELVLSLYYIVLIKKVKFGIHILVGLLILYFTMA